MDAYTCIDNPARRAECVLGIGSSSSTAGGSGGRLWQQTFPDFDKRCANYNCNTNYTPIWSKGPLGHKTLCNVCGIKYRPKVEKKRNARTTTDTPVRRNSPLGHKTLCNVCGIKYRKVEKKRNA